MQCQQQVSMQDKELGSSKPGQIPSTADDDEISSKTSAVSGVGRSRFFGPSPNFARSPSGLGCRPATQSTLFQGRVAACILRRKESCRTDRTLVPSFSEEGAKTQHNQDEGFGFHVVVIAQKRLACSFRYRKEGLSMASCIGQCTMTVFGKHHNCID